MTRSFLFSRRRFLKTAGAALFAGTGTYGYASRIEPHWIQFVRRDLPVAGLPSELDGCTLIQLSDLHAGPDVDDEYLTDALDRVSRLQPDIVAMTGDFMTCERTEQLARTLHVMKHLQPARLATVAVLGNHDYGAAFKRMEVGDKLSDGLADLGIEVLRNGRRDVSGLAISGIDDVWGPRFRHEDILPHLNPSGANLVLCHNPDVADLPIWCGYRGWVLSGHTHGGQCKMPFLPPPFLPVRNRRYVAGEYDLFDGRRMYINRGLGHLRQVRFNVRPEVTVFTLRREASTV
jgi:predicted MPP superfamily phosphohydrolase